MTSNDGFVEHFSTDNQFEDKNSKKIKRCQRKDFITPKVIYSNHNSTDNFSNNSDNSLKHESDDEDICDSSFKADENEDKNKIIGYCCQYPDCDYQNRNKGNVSRHISKMHLNKKQISCNECDLKFWGYKRLTEHKKQSHFGNLIYNNKKYKCDWNECRFESKSITNLRVHKRRHLGEKPFKCEFPNCSSSFVNNSELKLHRSCIHSDESPFKCDWLGCDEAFKTRDRLKRHTILHTGDYPYRCEWPGCDAHFVKNADYKLHQLCLHSDEMPFRCEWPGCESAFKTKNGLKRHTLAHTGEKPFKCEWPGCEARFYMNSKLTRHKAIHDGIKRYVCSWPECDMKYSTSHNLKLHLMVHRNERPFMCPQCLRRFTDRAQMNRHCKKVHKINPYLYVK